jgi:hypothetical protein
MNQEIKDKLLECLNIDFSKYIIAPDGKIIEKSIYDYLIKNQNNNTFKKVFKNTNKI